jgi:hypothetical protein
MYQNERFNSTFVPSEHKMASSEHLSSGIKRGN